VQSHAYAAACQAEGLRALEKACPLLVPLVEEGWTKHPVTVLVARIYLSELHMQASASGLHPDTIILGCTHYPLLREVIEQAVGELWPRNTPQVIDSAEVTAHAVLRELEAAGRKLTSTLDAGPRTKFYATDSGTKFRQLGSRFLGQPIGEVELVDLGG
jgi:glutamate racemase